MFIYLINLNDDIIKKFFSLCFPLIFLLFGFLYLLYLSDDVIKNGMIWLICDSLSFYAHVHICSPSYTDEEYRTNVDCEAVCVRLLIKGLIVSIRICILCIAYH